MTEPRFLRSKRERAALWYAADGMCIGCGTALAPSWHADHRIPWLLLPRTNIHELQAYCPACNQTKGARMETYRTFQKDFMKIVNDILAGTLTEKYIFCPITPGGGKSTLPLMLSRLIPRIADKLCWLVPRLSLADQAERTFMKPQLAQLFPHTMRIRHDTNTPNPSRGLDGYTTTYNALAHAPTLHAQEFARHRYLLFLDEPHHLKTHLEQPEHPEFAWSHAVQPLIDQAAIVVLASGTLYRHDQKPIFGLPYRLTPDGALVDLPPFQTCRYGRDDALKEQAIVPLQFMVRDAQAAWRDRNGKPQSRESFDETSYESAQMLEVVLETGFAKQLLAETVEHWQAHRQYYDKAKLLVVAPNIPLARRYVGWLHHDFGLRAQIATSEESQAAHEAIKAFKGLMPTTCDVLVTVGMAYEGLDVPEITHIACLTRYRSRPWLEQCFARACRTAEGKRAGYVFAPDDPLLQEVVAAIRQEQDDIVKNLDPSDLDQNLGANQGLQADPLGRIIPENSRATEMRAGDMDQFLSRAETARSENVMKQFGIHGISPYEFYLASLAMQFDQPPAPQPIQPMEDLTPSEQEEKWRHSIDRYTRNVDATYFDKAWGTTNRMILRQGFGERESMPLPELLQLWSWINSRWPLQPMTPEEEHA